jgi:hypothetical protein
VTVFPDPKASFIMTGDSVQCRKGNIFLFTNTTTAPNDTVLHDWNFGGGLTSVLKDPVINYPVAGDFTMKYVATTKSNGCKDSVVRILKVNDSPVSSFTVNNKTQCLKHNLFQFTNTSTLGTGTMSSKWTFGDAPVTVVVQSPSHGYLADGNFEVRLKSTSNRGCEDSTSQTVTVYPSPAMDFSINGKDQCLGIATVFTNNTQISSGNVNMTWFTGDSIIYTNQAVLKYKYKNTGTYNIKLIAKSDKACSDTLADTITVYVRPGLPVLTGDTVVQRHSSNLYRVVPHVGSLWNWIIENDSAHSNAQADSLRVYWGSGLTGRVGVSEVFTANGCASDTARFTIRLTPGVGIGEMNLPGNIRIFPQPASDRLMLSGDLDELQAATVTGMDGRIVRVFSAEELRTGELNTADIRSGTYVLQVRNTRGESGMVKLSILH